MKRNFEESLLLTYPLLFVGGFFDAYSYLIRGKTFATMQTGNMILLVYNLFEKEFVKAAMYLIPIFAFFMGVVIAQIIETKLKKLGKIKWYEIIILLEIILVIITMFIPIGDLNYLANMLISFAAGIQLNSFRKANGLALATTMCTGNLKSAGTNLADFILKREKKFIFNFLLYVSLILVFMLGCFSSYILTNKLNNYSIAFVTIPLIFILIVSIIFKVNSNDKKSDIC